MIHIKIIKKANKIHSCHECLGDIKIGEMYIRAFGYDYDDNQISEHIHAKPECFIDWFSNIDLAEPSDYPELREMLHDHEMLVTNKRMEP